MASTEDRVRIQFDMSKESVDRLDKIRGQISAPSRAHVFRKALGLYQWFLELTKEGGDIYIVKNNEKFKILFTDLV